MSENEELLIRVSNDLRFVREILSIIVNEADSFGGQMLRERLAVEREAVRLEQERADRETLRRQIENEQQQEYKSE